MCIYIYICSVCVCMCMCMYVCVCARARVRESVCAPSGWYIYLSSTPAVAVFLSSTHHLFQSKTEKQKTRSLSPMHIFPPIPFPLLPALLVGDTLLPLSLSRQLTRFRNRQVAMLPYAFCGVTVAVIFVICVMGRISKYANTDK